MDGVFPGDIFPFVFVQVHKSKSTMARATAYYVTIIPKKPGALNQCFTPSDKKTGMPRPAQERIRIIDGRSFYSLVTGIPEALDQLNYALPKVIQERLSNSKQFSNLDLEELQNYFTKAYLE